jgi:hypothetical protein
MHLERFFAAQHAACHASDVYEGRTPSSDRVLGGLSEAQLRMRPGPGLNSLVWLLWHMARTEDVAVNLVVAARAQVLDDTWMRRMNVGHRHMGTGMTADEVAELSAGADIAGVRAYRSAVGRRTREIVGALRPEAWDEILGLADTTRAAELGAFGPNDDWVEGVGHRPWQGLARGDQLGHSAIRHNMGHLGEAVTLRGLGGFGLGV